MAVTREGNGVTVDVKLENEVTLSREELADWLADLAEALREDDSAELPLAGPVLTLALSDEMHVEIDVNIDGDNVELELELAWSTREDQQSESRNDAVNSEDAEGSDDAGNAEDGAVAKARVEDGGVRKGGSGNGTPQRRDVGDGRPESGTRASSSKSSSGSDPALVRMAAGRPKLPTRATGKASTTNGAQASPART